MGQSFKLKRVLSQQEGNKANTIYFDEINTTKLRVVMKLGSGMAVGISEFETWGPISANLQNSITTVTANLAYKTRANVSASYTLKFDNIDFINDGLAHPNSRWTTFESPSKSDWVQFDFHKIQEINAAYLYFFNDKAGVQPPQEYTILYWNGADWKVVKSMIKKPAQPIGDLNVTTFKNIKTSKIKVVFSHRGEKIFTGLYEIELFDN